MLKRVSFRSRICDDYNNAKQDKINSKMKVLPTVVALMLHMTLSARNCVGTPCFKLRVRGWTDVCINVTCPYQARCVSLMNTKGKYTCQCEEECYNVGDSTDNVEVCGSDEVNYRSMCELRRRACLQFLDIHQKYEGKCNPCANYACEPQQVCRLNAQRKPFCDCRLTCDNEKSTKKVCASDGRTYPSRCVMEHESCLKGVNITVVHERACTGRNEHCTYNTCAHPYEECRISATQLPHCVCPTLCEKIYEPVCGSDGITYDSICHLKIASCRSQQPVDVIHLGTCSKLDQCGQYRCPPEAICKVIDADAFCVCPQCPSLDTDLLRFSLTKQVCGSDERTYESECWLRRAACQRMFRGADRQQSGDKEIVQAMLPQLLVKHQGACNACASYSCESKGKPYATCRLNGRGLPYCHCPDNCVYDGIPVCGSDGKMYLQECDMQRHACNIGQRIHKVAHSRCVDNSRMKHASAVSAKH